MIIDLHEDERLHAAVGGIKQWLLTFGQVTPGMTAPDGNDPGWKAAYRLLKEYGDGEYEVKEDGKLFKGEDMVVHQDDVKAFAFGEEPQVKPEPKKKADDDKVTSLENVRKVDDKKKKK